MHELIAAAERFVRQALHNVDASHDFWHIERVRANAKALAAEEGLDANACQVVELAALLHDVADWKYSADEHANQRSVQAFLDSQGADAELTSQVLRAIQAVGFKDELPLAAAPPSADDDTPLAHTTNNNSPSLLPAPPQLPLEAAVLQDADRLDAMGAVGIARCFTFGGAQSRMLYDPAQPPRQHLSKQDYMAAGGGSGNDGPTTINHFYEKLLKLKGLMKTAAGRRRAEERHAFMEAYLAQFYAEWGGQA